MHLTRRAVLTSLAAPLVLAALPGCGGPSARARPATPVASYPSVPDAGFDRWVADFRPRAAAQGINEATLNAAFSRAGFLPGVIDKDRNQAEFALSLEDYLAITVSDARVQAGRAVFQSHGALLDEIEHSYGVDAHVIAAIWGVESYYGTKRGTVPVISALSTLAYEGRRAAFFEAQLIAALKILQNGDVTVQNMTGGWAGAMGHTQFIPTTYAAYAVDFRGDGRRDIWSDDPTDALASAAHYLAKSGWSYQEPWGMEVRLPKDFNRATAGNLRRRSTAEWSSLGVLTADGGRLTDHGAASVILPAGTGPAFLIFRNYTVITRYNAAQKYVIGVGHLSDRIKGAGPLRTPFPPDANGMLQRDRIEMQTKLTRMGYDTGSADGVFGPKTAAAVKGYQQSRGLPADGQASMSLLAMMR